MTSFLPDAFRCFGHLESLYARNLPRWVCDAAEGNGSSPACRPAAGVEAAHSRTHSPPSSSSELLASPTTDVPHPLRILGDATYLTLSGFSPTPALLASPSWPQGRAGEAVLQVEGEDRQGGTANAEERVSGDPPLATQLCYRSEVSTGTQHPVWEPLPPTLRAALAACTRFTLEVYSCADGSFAASHGGAALELGDTAPGTARARPHDAVDRRLTRLPVDLSQLRYVAASVAQADRAVAADLCTDLGWSGGGAGGSCGPIPFLDAKSSFALYFVCTDGVFALPDPRTSPAQGGGPTEVAWSRSPAGCGTYLARPPPPPPATAPQASPPPSLFAPGMDRRGSGLEQLAYASRLTVGDTRALAAASLAWKYLYELSVARRQEQLDAIDVAAKEQGSLIEAEVAAAAARAAGNAAREALTVAALAKERLDSEIEARQALVSRQAAALERLRLRVQESTDPAVEAELHEAQRRQELERAQLRSQLGRARQAVVLRLVTIYPVMLSPQYGAPLRNARNAKDSVAGHVLPYFPLERGGGRGGGGAGSVGNASGSAEEAAAAAVYAAGLFANSADDLHEEGLAMGHAAHVLQTLAALYGCRLPHPLVVAGTRSRVLLRSDITPSEAAAPVSGPEDEKLPLACTRAADRPLLRAAVRLVMRDAAVLAGAMGKDEERVLACGSRVGAALHYLMNDW